MTAAFKRKAAVFFLISAEKTTKCRELYKGKVKLYNNSNAKKENRFPKPFQRAGNFSAPERPVMSRTDGFVMSREPAERQNGWHRDHFVPYMDGVFLFSEIRLRALIKERLLCWT